MEYGAHERERGGDLGVEEDLVCRLIVLGRMSQLNDGIVKHHADKEG